MTGLLKDNIVATGLLGFAAIVLLLALVMQLTGDLNLTEADLSESQVAGPFAGGGFSLPGELEAYTVIDERPLFNTTRRPIAIDDVSTAEGFAETGEVQPLNAALTGVVIVDNKMIVVLQDNDSKQFVRTSVGAGMDGVFADWRVEEIGPRSVTLTSFDGESMQLDMQIAKSTPAAPVAAKQADEVEEAEPTGREKYQQAILDAGKADNNESRAEEIRRRIAERRAQLQAAADKKAARENGYNDDDK